MLVAALLFCACGCNEREIAWLPDSSGFVYTDKKGTRLVQYDVGKKARRVIAEDAKMPCRGPAVSPDGKCFAVARCEATSTAGSRKQTRKFVVAIFDREGREQSRSKVLEVVTNSADPADETRTGADDWSLVCWEGHPDRLLTPFGIYDRKADRWTKLPAIPAVFLVPGCPPTAKGFLATYVPDPGKPGATEREGERKVCFVDWDGWASDFKEPVKGLTGDGRVAGGWDDRTWRMVTTGGVYSFDTTDMKHEFTKTPDKTWDALGRPRRYGLFAGTDLALGEYYNSKADSFLSGTRLELHSLAKKRRKVVYAEGEYSGFHLYPSPNGKLVAVRCVHSGETQFYDEAKSEFVPRVPPVPPKNVIVVFDDTGEVVATVKPE